MSIVQQEKKYYSVEEYFELDNNSEIRYEFYDGEVFAMAGTTKNHNKIADKFKDVIKSHFRPQGCEVYNESVKLEAIKNFYYPYPDVMLTCDKRDAAEEYIVAYPSLIAEVLSKTTEGYDRDFKLKRYKKIPSLQYYLLISQYEVSIEMYSRINESDIWTYQFFEEINETITLEKLDFSFPVSAIYENITFVPPSTEKI
ncbi:MAG: Uma2 family endonuclease [Verrucomicrobia bacterium]|nr:Uma2 family endonuclease [Cytophagales bacterium]